MAVIEQTHEHDEALEIEEMTSEDIDGSFVPRIKPEVDGVEIDGEAVLIIQDTWSIHWLNQISTIVFAEFDGVSTVDEVADRLSGAFKADPEVVRNDVLQLTRQLGGSGFLEGVAADQIRPVAPSFEGLPLGTFVPAFELSDLKGRTVTHEVLRGQQTFLVNWSPVCGYCSKIAPDIAKLQPKLQSRGVQTMFISIGTAKDLKKQLKEFDLDIPVLLDATHEAEIFEGLGTPAAYLIDAEGKTATELAYGANDVPALLRQAAGVRAKRNGSKKSTPAKKSTRAKRGAGSKTRSAAG